MQIKEKLNKYYYNNLLYINKRPQLSFSFQPKIRQCQNLLGNQPTSPLFLARLYDLFGVSKVCEVQTVDEVKNTLYLMNLLIIIKN